MTDERTSPEFAFLTVREAARLLRSKKVSSLELTNEALARIERLNPSLNAFITVTAEISRKQARVADREIRAGKNRGLLHGLPVTIKDNYWTRGVRTTAGSQILSAFVPTADSDVAARLATAGAVLLGKTNLNEFAYGINGLNPHYGEVHNPWALARTTGGSSSGSAAAVAAGIGFGSVGTDTGGSLRIPASFCGIVGFKPTYGLVSVAGVVPLAESLDHAGPLARTVDDAAAMFAAIAGEYPHGARRAKAKTAARSERMRFKIGWPQNYFFERVDSEVEVAIERAVRVMESMGARVEEVLLPHLEDSVGAATTVGLAEASRYHAQQGYFPARAVEYSEDVRGRLKLGMEVSAVDYLQAALVRRQLTEDFDRAFKRVDAIVAPATATVAPRLGESEIEIRGEKVPLRTAVVNANRPANFTGHPAISIPCGFSREGLPIGMQLIGRRWDEATLLGVARAYEQETDWHAKHPAL
jgi:aspartyl-tRNA(Asn)/glutamyl-tRNA(Gln) amidotransferase subunit A